MMSSSERHWSVPLQRVSNVCEQLTSHSGPLQRVSNVCEQLTSHIVSRMSYQRGAMVEWLEQLGYGAESRRIA